MKRSIQTNIREPKPIVITALWAQTKQYTSHPPEPPVTMYLTKQMDITTHGHAPLSSYAARMQRDPPFLKVTSHIANPGSQHLPRITRIYVVCSLESECYLRQGAHPAWQGAGGMEFARNGSILMAFSSVFGPET